MINASLNDTVRTYVDSVRNETAFYLSRPVPEGLCLVDLGSEATSLALERYLRRVSNPSTIGKLVTAQRIQPRSLEVRYMVVAEEAAHRAPIRPILRLVTEPV